MPLVRPPCLTSAYHSLSKGGPPLSQSIQRSHKSCHSMLKRIGIPWNSQNKTEKIQFWIASNLKTVNKVSSKTKPCFPLNPVRCPAAAWNYFATIFSELFCGGGSFMAPLLAESVGRWLQSSPKPNRGRHQARTSPRQPRPSPQTSLLQSSLKLEQIQNSDIPMKFILRIEI